MQTLKHWLLTAATLALCACSGSDNSITNPGGTTGTGTGGGSAASLTLLTSSPQIPSDGSANATITALVRDASNNVVAGQAVQFTASSGALVAVATPYDGQERRSDRHAEHRGRPDESHDHGHWHERQRSEHRERWRHWHCALAQRADRVADRQHAASTTWCSRPAAARASRTSPSTITSSKANGISQTPVIHGFHRQRVVQLDREQQRRRHADGERARHSGDDQRQRVGGRVPVLCAGRKHGSRDRHSRGCHSQLEKEQCGGRELADHVSRRRAAL